ncbi:MAG: nucleotidyltransferase family protein [Candidatus Acidifodinimicrobium sp.]
MKTDVIIMAGGFARRFAPISDYLPKPLFPVGGVPIINYVLEKTFETAPDNILVSTNKKYEFHFRHWLSTLNSFYPDDYLTKIHIILEPSLSEDNKLGAIAGLKNAIEQFKPENDLVVLLGDNLFNLDLNKFLSFGKSKNSITLAAFDIRDVKTATNFGVLETKEDKIVAFHEKPKSPPSSLVSTGIYFFPKHSIAEIDEYLKRGGSKDAMGSLFEYLIKNEAVYSYIFSDGFWFDVGTPELYAKANEFVLKSGLFRRWMWP